MNTSQRVRELYEQGYAANLIADMISANRNTVNRAISEHRRKTGIIVPVKFTKPVSHSYPQVESERNPDWRYFNYKKSVMGARAALREMNQ